MNRHTTIALLGAVFAVTAGMLSVNAFSATPFLVAQSASTTHDDALIQGHVTYVVKDSDGKIKSYIQSDNLVVDVGETCVAQSMFRSNGTNCDVFQDTGATNPSTTNGFNWIAIGNGTTLVAVDGSNTALPGGGTGGGEKQRLQSLAAITNSTTVGATAVMSKTFSFDAGSATTIRNSGLFDKSTTGHLFSAQDISVPVGASDTLTVTWTITLGS